LDSVDQSISIDIIGLLHIDAPSKWDMNTQLLDFDSS